MIISGRELYINNMCGNSEEKGTSNWVMNKRSLRRDYGILNELKEYMGAGKAERRQRRAFQNSMSKGVETGRGQDK